MGLSDLDAQARGQILMMSALLFVNQAYALVVSNEGKKLVASAIGVLGAISGVGCGNYEMDMYSWTSNVGFNNTQRFKKSYDKYHFVCHFCKCKGHAKENCYKLIGHSPNFKTKKKVLHHGLNGMHGCANEVACSVMTKNNIDTNSTIKLVMDKVQQFLLLVMFLLSHNTMLVKG